MFLFKENKCKEIKREGERVVKQRVWSCGPVQVD